MWPAACGYSISVSVSQGVNSVLKEVLAWINSAKKACLIILC